MARALRIKYPGAVYHITSRGNKKEPIFYNPKDRLAFFSTIKSVIKLHNWICHAYCLMDNHYHLLIETPDGNLSDGMRDLNSNYTQVFNKTHSTVGYLLQGRFHSFIIEKETYLLEVARYLVLNPVRAQIVQHPKDWEWSSYNATCGLSHGESFLTTDGILAMFSIDKAKAQQQYKQFILDGLYGDSIFKSVKHKGILGSPQFIHEMWKQSQKTFLVEAIPKEERIIGRLSLEDIFSEEGVTREARDKKIRMARILCGYSVAEIARFLKLSQALVSKISRKD
ncbi:hypothetical protein A2239_04080 [Candidatus Uhrbacteria bacterium RIFOXYA2_FULL_40_9]|nr:MAG: hypothetical protein UT94_C0016G0011 [Candidatus Uhrbacteria bacterium GW2011_GWF2_40_263]OGL94196.1 MAG: hypothetical protein A2239_04080 [Candidatus Uhrbacteria bacterium RIFOXYA2_FULL_40_9]OGL98210.1 MAG: hypothetical protein A2332_03835 [Candidatus Uhrbacteria bacterium RIFOXYB2_FULL_41_18]HBK35170.1 addiction module toxin RelE [Candidatus Uhrbacteria bacterium]HCB56044.1 addiction module toxin RelE [Candidatus Uhrbacteria bacterium]